MATRDNKVMATTTQALISKGATLGTKNGKNHLYALFSHQEFEASHSVITGTLQLFPHNVYVLMDTSSTLS